MSDGPLTRDQVVAFALAEASRIAGFDWIGGLVLQQLAPLDTYITILSQRLNVGVFKRFVFGASAPLLPPLRRCSD